MAVFKIISKLLKDAFSSYESKEPSFVLKDVKHAIEYLLGTIEYEICHFDKSETYSQLDKALNTVKNQFPTLDDGTHQEKILGIIIEELEHELNVYSPYPYIEVEELQTISENIRKEWKENE